MVLTEVLLNFSRSSLVSESQIFFPKPQSEGFGHVTHAITGINLINRRDEHTKMVERVPRTFNHFSVGE